MSRKLKGNAIVSSSVTETQLSTEITDKITNAYNQANSAYGQANNAAVRVTANSGTAISSNTISFNNTATVSVVVEANESNANISFIAAPQTVVNDTYTAAGNVAAAATANIANGLYAIGTGAYDQANGAYAQANGAYAQANGAYAQANIVYDQANNAYAAANNSNLKLGGLITGTLNVTQDLIVGGNVYLEGNTTYINVATYSVEDSLIYLASNNELTDSVDIGFMGGKNTSGSYSHTGLARDATDGKWKLFDGLADEGHVGNVVDFANTYLATLVANVEANSITIVGNAVATAANTTAAYDKSNIAIETVTVSQNGGSTLVSKKLNFVNTANVKIAVTDPGDGNANISFDTTISGTNTSIVSQTFSAANGAANLQYVLTYTPWAVEYVFVSKNGIALLPTTDFTLSGNTITVIPTGEADDSIEARYFVDVSLIPPSNTTIIIDSNTVTAQTNTFYTSQNVATINRLTVTKNGLRLTPNSHYTFSDNNTITLTSVAEVDDEMVFEYFFDLGNIQDVGYTAYIQANAAYDAANNRVLKAGDTMTGNLNVAATLITQNVIPDANVTYDLGTSTARFKDLWLSNSTIYLGEASISAQGGNVSFGNAEIQLSNVSTKLNVTNDLFVSGDVGIGTASPSSKLHISGDDGAIYIDRTNGNPFVYFGVNGDFANTAAIYGATDGLRFYTGTATPERMRLTSAGFVGIGTSSPNTGLHVYDASINATAKLQNANTDGYAELIFQSATKVSSIFQASGGYTDYGGANSFNIYAASGSKIAFHPGASANQVVFDTNGNVGIGTSVPASKLDVSGGSLRVNEDGAGTKVITIRSDWAGVDPAINVTTNNSLLLMTNNTERARIDLSGNLCLGSSSPGNAGVINLSIGNPGTTVGGLQLWSTTSGTHYVQFGDSASGGDPYRGALGYVHASDAMTFWTAGGERARIDSSGNVGIGTTSPASLLNIHGANPDLIVNNTGVGNSGVKIRYNGSSTHGLHLTYQPNDATAYIDNTYQANQGTVYGDIYFRQNVAGSMTTRMTIKADGGNIGIGTTVPNNTLDIRGSFDLHAPNSTTNPTTFGFYHFFIQTASYNYAHLKTNIPTGSGSTQYGMFLIEATGYNYGSADTIKSMWGMHNWNGGLYSLTVQNLGQWALAQTAYVSSDGFVVLVLYTGIGSFYHGARLDFIDINTTYAVHYTHPPRVTNAGYSDSTSGVF